MKILKVASLSCVLATMLVLNGCVAQHDARNPASPVDHTASFLSEARAMSSHLSHDDGALLSAGLTYCNHLEAGTEVGDLSDVNLRTPVQDIVAMRRAAADNLCPDYADAVRAWATEWLDKINGATTGN